MQNRDHIAARAARWSVANRRKALLGWLAFVILAAGVGGAAGLNTLSLNELGTGESGRADKTLNAAGFSQPARERVLVEGAAADVRAASADLSARLDEVPAVTNLQQPIVTDGGRTALIGFDLRGKIDDAGETVAPAAAAIADVTRAHDEVRIGQSGDGTMMAAVEEQLAQDFKKAELGALPLTLAILAIAFGALMAAIVPVALGLSAVMAAIGVLSIVSQGIAFEQNLNSIVLLIGLAVGVDYALFYVRREREERAAGRPHLAAIEAAAKTSGHAVLVSGMTVIGSVAAMFISENVWYRTYAAGIIVVVAIAMVGSVTVLPALLSWLGDRIEKGRIPVFGRRAAAAGDSRFWGGIVDRVVKRPLVSLLAATALLLALAFPITDLKLAEQGLKSLPADMEAVANAQRVQAQFPGGALPATIVVSGGDLRSGQRAEALQALATQVGSKQVELAPGGDVARVLAMLPGSGTDDASDAALTHLREDVIPATLGRAGLHGDVTGQTAWSADLRSDTTGKGPIVIGAVLLMALLMLGLTFRSVVVPVKAVLLNLLSIAATYGVLVLVFQKGWGDSLLGFQATGSVSTWVPVFLFLLLFGLSMDYHVFILSRIREGVDRGLSTRDAVRQGLRSTAGVVTSAAVVMVGVFGIFASLSQVEVKQIGVGLAVAVLIDATIIRAVLLPAAMALLGERNWWLPSPLRRFARVAPAPVAEPARA
jgi:RND superfamily putative drug exporter